MCQNNSSINRFYIQKRPLVTVDFHGHSKRCNVFFFGNNPEESWRMIDHSIEHDAEFMVLPELLDQTAPGFALSNCRFGISKAKEPSNRVVLWRQFGVSRYSSAIFLINFESDFNCLILSRKRLTGKDCGGLQKRSIDIFARIYSRMERSSTISFG